MPGKETIFTKGAEAIRRITGADKDLYACPLCRSAFPEEALDTGSLTLEHVPPDSIDGRGIVLTCHKCNSKAGHTIEAQLHRRRELIKFAQALTGEGDYSGRIQLTMSETETNVDAEIEDGQLRMVVPDEINDPEHREGQFEKLDQMAENDTWDGYKFNVSPAIRYNPRVADLSYLKSGYLAAFAALGYLYAMQKSLEVVREQLSNPEEQLISNYMITLPESEPTERKMIRVEEPLNAIAVQIDRRLVFLPPVDSHDKFYESFNELFKSQSDSSNFRGMQWDFPAGPEFHIDFLTT
jgi:hypothetical protein